MGGPGQAFDLQLHQTLRGEADHLAQEIGIGALFQKCAKGISSASVRLLVQRPNPTDESR